MGRLGPALGDDLLDELARKAVAGDAAALDQLVGHVTTPVYNLALRMLWHPHDAEDASQEILIKVITGCPRSAATRRYRRGCIASQSTTF